MKKIINGIQLAYDDVGSGLPVVLLHGFPLCRKMWHPQVRKLTEAGYRVVTLDLRGFGESDAPDGPYSMDLFADDVIALLDCLNVSRGVIGGMSMGGYVLLNLLQRYPERVAGACFLTTRATADDEAGKARRWQLAQDVLKFGPHIVTDMFMPLLFAEATITERPKLVSMVCEWMASTDSRGLAGGLLAMRERPDCTAMLSSVGVPALVIGAELDAAAPLECSVRIAENIPGCLLRVIPEAGHMANLENPGAFNSAILEFLATLPR